MSAPTPGGPGTPPRGSAIRRGLARCWAGRPRSLCSKDCGDVGNGSAEAMTPVAIVVPVYRNEDTLAELVRRIDVALAGRAWELHLVVDASPDKSADVGRQLAQGDGRVV